MSTRKTAAKTLPKPPRSQPSSPAGAAPAMPVPTPGTGGEWHQSVSDGGTTLTTNQGIPIADNQNSLQRRIRAGRRCSRTSSSARRSPTSTTSAFPSASSMRAARAAHGYFELTESLAEYTHREGADRGRRTNAGLHPLLDRRRRRRLGRHAARRARLRGQVLHQGRQLGPRRQQHPGVLHPGRDQVPRPDPRGEDGARPRLPAGGDRARHLLGLHLADARVDAHGDVDHVRPHDPALAAHDRRLRHPQLPADQRRGRVDLRQVPLAPRARAAVDGLGRGGQDRRRRPRLPPPRPVRGDRSRRFPGVGAGGPAVHRGGRRRVPVRPPRLDQADPRGTGAAASDRPHGARPLARQLLRRDRAGRLLPGATSCPASTSRNDPLLQGRLFSYLDTQLSRLGSPNFHQIPINAPKCPFAQHPARRPHADAAAERPRRLRAELAVGRLRRARIRRRASAASRPIEGGERGRIRAETLRRPLQPGAAVLSSARPTPEQAHIASALVFELSKVEHLHIREAMVGHLRNIDEDLAQRVSPTGSALDAAARRARAGGAGRGPATRRRRCRSSAR